jgi:hypothetical protein
MSNRFLAIMLTLSLLTGVAVPCSAADYRPADNPIKELLENSLYGGLAGALVGGAFLAFTHKPEKHLEYLSVGAACGIIGGVTYSVAKQSKALASIDDGKVRFALPTIIPELQENTAKGTLALMVKAELLRGTF